MRRYTKSNAKLLQNEFSLERARLAQDLCDRGWSNDRIASELGLTRYVIEKWIKIGLLSVNADFHNRKVTEKQISAQILFNKEMTVKEAAENIGVHESTITRWRRQGKIK